MPTLRVGLGVAWTSGECLVLLWLRVLEKDPCRVGGSVGVGVCERAEP